MLPNFLIIGAAKSGTSSLHAYLRQHPGIFFSPVKEPCFFHFEGERVDFKDPLAGETYRTVSADEIDACKHERRSLIAVNELSVYERLFTGVRKETAVGEASVLYLPSERAPARIRDRIPRVRLIAILRHPVERCFSGYLSQRMHGREDSRSFEEALEREEQRVRDGWVPGMHYTRLGFYGAQLSRYFALFPVRQIRVFLHEDLVSDPLGVCRDIFRFLEVDPGFLPDVSRRHNVSRNPRSRLLARLLSSAWPLAKRCLPGGFRRDLRELAERLLYTERPPLAPATRKRLLELYRDDIRLLERVIERDLSHWLL